MSIDLGNNLGASAEVDLLDSFIGDLKVRGYSKGTIAAYGCCVKTFLKFYKIHGSINDFKNFLVYLRDENNYSKSTIENYFTSLSSFYDYLEWEHVIEKNIVPAFRKRYIRMYKVPVPDEKQLISLSQMRELIDSASDIQIKAIFVLFAKTGIRRQELIDLNLRDFNFESNLFRLKPHAKRSNRVLFFDDECKAILLKWVKWRYNHHLKKPYFFIGVQGGRISSDRVYDLTIEHASRLGLHDPKGSASEKFTPHCFRHFFTTWLRRSGCPKPFIQELRGDIRKDSMDIYDHIGLDELKETYLKYSPQLGVKL